MYTSKNSGPWRKPQFHIRPKTDESRDAAIKAVDTGKENPAPASGDGAGARLTSSAKAAVMANMTIVNTKALIILTWAIFLKMAFSSFEQKSQL